MERKEQITIRTHSAIDLITNSSTEMFIIDKSNNITVDIINAAIKEKFPDCELRAYAGTPDWFYYESDEEVEEHVRRLRARGYVVAAPLEVTEPEEIQISCERGGMSTEFKKFIIETFNGEYDTE